MHYTQAPSVILRPVVGGPLLENTEVDGYVKISSPLPGKVSLAGFHSVRGKPLVVVLFVQSVPLRA